MAPRAYYVEVVRAAIRTEDPVAALAWAPSHEMVRAQQDASAGGEGELEGAVRWLSKESGIVVRIDDSRFVVVLDVESSYAHSPKLRRPAGDAGSRAPLPVVRDVRVAGAFDAVRWAVLPRSSIHVWTRTDAPPPGTGVTWNDLLRIALLADDTSVIVEEYVTARARERGTATREGVDLADGLQAITWTHIDQTGDVRSVVRRQEFSQAAHRAALARVGWSPGETLVISVVAHACSADHAACGIISIPEFLDTISELVHSLDGSGGLPLPVEDLRGNNATPTGLRERLDGGVRPPRLWSSGQVEEGLLNRPERSVSQKEAIVESKNLWSYGFAWFRTSTFPHQAIQPRE